MEPRRSVKILIGNILHISVRKRVECVALSFPPIDLTGNKNSVKEASASGQTNSRGAVQAAGDAGTAGAALWATEPLSAQFCYQAERELWNPPPPTPPPPQARWT